MIRPAAARRWAAVALGALLAALLYSGGLPLRPLRWPLLLWLAPAVFMAWRALPRPRRVPRDPALWLAVVLLLYLFGSATDYPLFYYLGWSKPGESYRFFATWLERTLILTTVLFFILRAVKFHAGWLLVPGLLFMQASMFIALWRVTGGEPIYRVDHPAFFYRLWSFGQTMPRFIYYDPYWNGGKVMPYLVASGILAPGTFLWPVWRWVSTERAYTPAFGFLFIVVVPLLAAWATRILRMKAVAAVIAALLALGVSHFYFIHLLHYGTMGSLFAVAFLMPFTACLYRMVWMDTPRAWEPLVLGVTGFFLLLWPPTTIMAIPLGLALAASWRRLDRRRLMRLAVPALVLVVLGLLPALSLLRHSEVGRFTETTQSLGSLDNLKAGWAGLRDHLRQAHPLLLFLGIAAVPLARRRSERRWWGLIFLSGLLIATLGKEWRATLQLDRVFINILFLACLPAAALAARAFGRPGRRRPLQAALFSALLLMGGHNAVRYYGNRGTAQFRTMSGELRDIVDHLRADMPPGGRLMFAGAAVHGYSAAKVAALPVYVGREMMSSDYYGFSPRLVEYNYPPRAWRHHGPDKLFAFMDVYNITHIVTFHEDWKTVFRRDPDRYQETAIFGEKSIFRVLRSSSMLLKGEGSVTAELNRIQVTLPYPQEEVVLKYNWVEGLEAGPGVELFPYPVDPTVDLIAIRPGTHTEVTLRYAPLW